MDPENDDTQHQAYSFDHQLPQRESTPELTLTPQDSPPEKAPPRPDNWKSCLLPVAGLIGLAVVFFAFMILYNHWSSPSDQAAEDAGTPTRNPSFLATIRPSSTIPHGTEMATPDEADIIPSRSTGNLAYVSFIDGRVFKSVEGSSVLLRLRDGLRSPTSLTSNPDSGVFIELADASDSASLLYLFFESTMNLVYDTAFSPQLHNGRLYLQTGLDEAAIHFPNHHNAIAILAGSTDIENANRMLVETVGTDIWIWCLSGICSVENEHGDSIFLLPMTKSLFHSETGDVEDAFPITTEELWAWQVACAYRCLIGFATPPLATRTITATPTIPGTAAPTQAQIPTSNPTATRLPPPTATPTKTLDPYPPPPTSTPQPYPYP